MVSASITKRNNSVSTYVPAFKNDDIYMNKRDTRQIKIICLWPMAFNIFIDPRTLQENVYNRGLAGFSHLLRERVLYLEFERDLSQT